MSLAGSITDWHHIFLISSFLGGIIYLTIKHYREFSYLVYGLLFALFSTIVYLTSSALCLKMAVSLFPGLVDVFPMVNYSCGLLITLIALIWLRPLLRLSSGFFRMISSSILFTLIASSVGAIIGYLHTFTFEDPLIASATSTPLNAIGFDYEKYIPISNGILIISFLTLSYFRNKLRHPVSLMLFIILVYMTLTFSVLFFINVDELILFSEKILGMNTVQWGLLLTALLLFLRVISIEGRSVIVEVKYKPILQSDYLLFFLYLLITVGTLWISPSFTLLDEYMFLSIFAVTTFCIIIYYYGRIRAPQLKLSVIGALLIMGFIYAQSRQSPSSPNDVYNDPIHLQEIYLPPISQSGSNSLVKNKYEVEVFKIIEDLENESLDLIHPYITRYNSFSSRGK